MPELDHFLLEAKLSIPKPRSGSVSRANVIAPAKASDCRVVGVTAPAGYGKSTMLSQWARSEDRRVAWVSLDRFDDDAAILLMLLASAYALISPGATDLVADVGGLGTSVLGRGAPRLASALRASPAPFVLMLDDLQALETPMCHDVLTVVMSGIPPGSQVVTASRFAQPHLPKMRASGDAIEVSADDLAMDAAGAEQIFAEAQVGVSPDVAAAVTRRAEGWPAGLYLAALIARDSRGEKLTVAGDDRYVADYLYRESLSRLPKRTRRFLRRTAVLDQMCAPLCDEILGEPGSQQHLQHLEDTNAFLVPLDRRREWFRYHGLFREFLLGELRRVEPEAVMKLHLRAADWYEANGSPALAVEHLLDTTERDRCVQLVTQLVLPTYNAGQMSVVQRWIAAVGDPAIETYPPLAVLAGWIAVLTGQTADAERWAAIADRASFDLLPVDGTASFDSARAMLRAAMCADGPERMMADASFAVAEEPAWSPWRDTAMLLLAHAHLVAGDVEQASARFAGASAAGMEIGNTDTIVDGEAQLAVAAIDQGRWDEAADHIRHALSVIDRFRMHDYAASVLAFAVAGRVALHGGDIHDADRQLTRAMRARPACTAALPVLAVRSRVQLAKAYIVRDDRSTTQHLLREIDEILRHRPDLGALVGEAAELRDLVDTRLQVGATGASPLTAAELRLLPYLQTHLTIGEIGARLFISRNTVSSEVTSIYRKLGVSSRSDAVDQATSIGLLGG